MTSRILIILTALISAGCGASVKYTAVNKNQSYASVKEKPIVLNHSQKAITYRFDAEIPKTRFHLKYKQIGRVSIVSKKKTGIIQKAVSTGADRGGHLIAIYSYWKNTSKSYQRGGTHATYQLKRDGSRKKINEFSYKGRTVIKNTYTLSANIYRQVRSSEEVDRVIAVKQAVKQGRKKKILQLIKTSDINSYAVTVPDHIKKQVYAALTKRNPRISTCEKMSLSSNLGLEKTTWTLYSSMPMKEKTIVPFPRYYRLFLETQSDNKVLQFLNDNSEYQNKKNTSKNYMLTAASQGRMNILQKTLHDYGDGISEKTVKNILNCIIISKQEKKASLPKALKIIKQYNHKKKKLNSTAWKELEKWTLFTSAGKSSRYTLQLLKAGIQAHCFVKTGNCPGRVNYSIKARRHYRHYSTPLHNAATWGNLTAARYLLTYGARAYTTDCAGNTPSQLVNRWARYGKEQKHRSKKREILKAFLLKAEKKKR